MGITESGKFVTPKATILIVDDSNLQLKLLRRWLVPDFNVVEAVSGRQALDVLNGENSIDLVLMDMSMPDMTGLEALAKIREIETTPTVPVILMSAADRTSETAARSVQEGGHDYLFKPLIKDLLRRKIDTILAAVRGQLRSEVLRDMMKEKENEINELKSVLAKDGTHTVTTPMDEVTSAIIRIMQEPSIKESPVKSELQSILQAICTTDLYRPALVGSLDPVTNSFLLADLSEADTGATRRTFPSYVQETSVASLQRWEFNQFEEEEALLPLIKEMFASFGLLDRFNIKSSTLEQFIMEVRAKYNDNPYHCFRHAFDVTQTCYAILTSFSGAKYLTHLDILALLVSALAHDIDHPGTNNSYQCTALTNLAITYNDKSVLEQHHCSTLFRVLSQEDLNILSGLTKEELLDVRKRIIGCILHTDPTLHFESTSKLQQRLKLDQPVSCDSDDDRRMVIQTILMTADISNIAKPWEVAKVWAERVSQEFFAQGDLEKSEGRHVAPFMDRTQSSMEKTSVNFTEYMALPLYEVVVQLFPEMNPVLSYMDDNRRRHKRKMQEREEREERGS